MYVCVFGVCMCVMCRYVWSSGDPWVLVYISSSLLEIESSCLSQNLYVKLSGLESLLECPLVSSRLDLGELGLQTAANPSFMWVLCICFVCLFVLFPGFFVCLFFGFSRQGFSV